MDQQAIADELDRVERQLEDALAALRTIRLQLGSAVIVQMEPVATASRRASAPERAVAVAAVPAPSPEPVLVERRFGHERRRGVERRQAVLDTLAARIILATARDRRTVDDRRSGRDRRQAVA